MRRTLLAILALLPIAASAQTECPPEPSALVLPDNILRLCGQAVTATRLEIEATHNGNVDTFIRPGPVGVGEIVTYQLGESTGDLCGDGQARARSCDDTECGPWGTALPATFRVCLPAPRIYNPVP